MRMSFQKKLCSSFWSILSIIKKRLSELIIRKRDSGLLQSFLELKDGEENFIADVLAVTDMLALAAQDEWSEGSVILHRFKKENLLVSRKRRFEF